MGRNQKKPNNNQNSANQPNSFGGKYAPKNKQVQKDNKDRRQKSVEPERKQSRPNIDVKASNIGTVSGKGKSEVKVKGVVDSGKINEVK